MEPTQPIQVLDPLQWHRSTVTEVALNELVNGGQLAPNVDGQPPAWIVPPAADREPNPPFGYVVSFARHHERGFTVPVSRFMRGLCHQYAVELHNFAPNAISQAATFVGVCEGFLGTQRTGISGSTSSARSCTRSPLLSRGRVVRASGMSSSLRDSRRHSLHDDLQQRRVGAGVVLPPQQ
jgi:hypothetical protein